MNLVWLALFLRGNFKADLCAAIIGFFAIGIHQVHFHLFFAFPFLLALFFGRIGRSSFILPYLLTYPLGIFIWVLWPELALYFSTDGAFAFPKSLLEISYPAIY